MVRKFTIFLTIRRRLPLSSGRRLSAADSSEWFIVYCSTILPKEKAIVCKFLRQTEKTQASLREACAARTFEGPLKTE
jgi:hypothetical protein